MNELFVPLMAKCVQRGDLPQDVAAFFKANGYLKTLDHSVLVAAEALRLAVRFGVDPVKANHSGWLHDISAVFLDSERVKVAEELGLELLVEERINPVVVHQKISAVMAQEIFNVQDEEILAAVGHHTTLRARATQLELVLFVADKTAWDQEGTPVYLAELQAALETSLEKAALVYLHSLWERRDHLPGPLHPWAMAAMGDLEKTIQEN
jgi:predicted HD superfamily hydrolase involved in NAD metabolism